MQRDQVQHNAGRQIAAAARRHGKFAGTVATVENLPGLYDEGYRFLNLGADVIGLGQYLRGLAATFASFQAQLPADQA